MPESIFIYRGHSYFAVSVMAYRRQPWLWSRLIREWGGQVPAGW